MLGTAVQLGSDFELLAFEHVLVEVEFVDTGEHILLATVEVALLCRLDLDSRVEYVKLFLEELGAAVEGVARVSGHNDVRREHYFVVGEGPHVEVVDLFHVGLLIINNWLTLLLVREELCLPF